MESFTSPTQDLNPIPDSHPTPGPYWPSPRPIPSIFHIAKKKNAIFVRN